MQISLSFRGKSPKSQYHHRITLGWFMNGLICMGFQCPDANYVLCNGILRHFSKYKFDYLPWEAPGLHILKSPRCDNNLKDLQHAINRIFFNWLRRRLMSRYQCDDVVYKRIWRCNISNRRWNHKFVFFTLNCDEKRVCSSNTWNNQTSNRSKTPGSNFKGLRVFSAQQGRNRMIVWRKSVDGLSKGRGKREVKDSIVRYRKVIENWRIRCIYNATICDGSGKSHSSY